MGKSLENLGTDREETYKHPPPLSVLQTGKGLVKEEFEEAESVIDGLV